MNKNCVINTSSQLTLSIYSTKDLQASTLLGTNLVEPSSPLAVLHLDNPLFIFWSNFLIKMFGIFVGVKEFPGCKKIYVHPFNHEVFHKKIYQQIDCKK